MSNALEMLQAKTNEPILKTQNSMEGLSDSDLKTLLQNFKDLSTDEQHGLITYLKKLEAKEPERVERLRKFVKLGPNNSEGSEKAYTSGRTSPFSNREVGANPCQDDIDKKSVKPVPLKKLIDSDEDDDYTFEDVFRAASKNVNEKQNLDENSRSETTSSGDKTDLGVNLTDAKMIIANLMGQLGATNKNSNPGFNLLGLASLNSTTGTNSTTSVTSNLLNLPNNDLKVNNTNPPVDNPYPQNNMNYNNLADYNYPQNRQFDSNYDEYNQFQNPTSNYPSDYTGGMDYGASGSNMNYGMQQEYHNAFPNQSIQPRPQFNRPNFPQYDPRQGYY